MKSRMGSLRNFGDGFESGHEIRNDLELQKARNGGSSEKRGMKIGRSATSDADAQEDDEEQEHETRRPVLKTRAPATAPVVQHRKKTGEPDPQQQARQENGLPRNTVQFERIQRWKDVRRKLSDRHRLPRTNA